MKPVTMAATTIVAVMSPSRFLSALLVLPVAWVRLPIASVRRWVHRLVHGVMCPLMQLAMLVAVALLWNLRGTLLSPLALRVSHVTPGITVGLEDGCRMKAARPCAAGGSRPSFTASVTGLA